MKKASKLPKPRPVLEFKPLTPDRWADFEQLFGARGACGGCWCLYWRLPRAQFEAQKGEANRQALQQLVATGAPTGLLAYAEEVPIGWCAVAPREDFPVLERSRILRRLDEQPVWSIVCLFVAKAYRRRGVTIELLKAAQEFVRRQGGRVLEGYPVEPKKEAMPNAFAWTGLASAFRQAGFRECARRSETRPLMRYEL